MLTHFGVIPYIVFDGDRLPSKAATEESRRQGREEARVNGLRYLHAKKIPAAFQELQKAIDITPDIARMFIETLKAAEVRYVVAPYEADSQMVYLEQQGIVDGIVSEDSDLLVFGAKCLLTKLDQYGECIMVDKDQFGKCREVNLTGWTNDEFRTMAILSGCDYLKGVNRMGLKTAHRLVRKYKKIDRVLRGAGLEGKFYIPPEYLQNFVQAERTFQYQWVFCPTAERLVHFTALPRGMNVDDLPFIGEYVDETIAQQVAEGELDPMSKEKIFLTSDQWASVRQHLEKATLCRAKSTSTASHKPEKPSSKPIDTFFRRNRPPLATADPNSNHCTNDKQGLRSTENGKESSKVLRKSTCENQPPIPRSYSAPTSRIAVPHPPKRRRLCDDSPSKTAVQTERSKFFGDTSTAAKSSLQIRKSKQNAAALDFQIFSDDSIEGAMADLPEPEIIAKSRSVGKRPANIEIYRGDDQQQQQQQQHEMRPLGDEATHDEAGPPPSSPRTEESDYVSPFTAALRSETRALRKRSSLQAFALDAKTSKDQQENDILSPSNPQGIRRRPTLTHTTSSPILRRHSPDEALVTPARPTTTFTPHASDDVIWDSPPTQRHSRNQVDTQSTTTSLKFNTPAWLPEDSGYGSQPEASQPKGSEDLLVGASDTEPNRSSRSASEEACVADSSPAKEWTGLSKFAFTM